MSEQHGSTSAALRFQGTLGVVSACAVMLYLVYGRVFAVALLLPFARFATAMAAIGVAFGGVLGLLLRDRFASEGGDRRLALWVAAFGFFAPFAQLMVVEHVPIEQKLTGLGFVTLGAASLMLAVPFVIAGVIGVATLVPRGRDLHRAWATALLGAAVGALLAIPLLRFLPANVVALVVGAAGCWLALLLAADADTSMRVPLASAVAVLLLGVLAATQDVFRFYNVKAWATPYTEDVAWNVSSRVGVFPPAAGTTAIKTLPLAKRADDYASVGAPDFKWLDVDGTAWTPMLRFDGDLGRMTFLLESVVYAADRLQRDARVLVVGVGGGRDILAARAAGAPHVVGIEQNPAVARMVEERFRHVSGGPYQLDGVEVLLGPPRVVLAQLTDPFDVVQIGTSTTGTLLPFLEDENYLYTREAFREYFRLLTPRGLFSVTRHYTAQNPLEILRLLATIRDAWAAEGVANASPHLVVLVQDFSATVLARRDPFGPAELAAVDQLVAATGMTLLFDPRKAAPGTDDATLLVGPAGHEFDTARYDVRPTTDDWPFFAQVFRSATAKIPGDPFQLLVRGQAAFALISLLAVVALGLAVVCVAAATLAPARSGERTPVTLLVYCLGTGYGAVALVVPLLERLRLLVGSDVATVVVAAIGLGLAGAAGSALGARVGERGALLVAVVLGGASAVVALLLTRLGGSSAGGSTMGTLLLAAAGLLPLGVLLGMVVPLGLRAGGVPDPRAIAAGVALHGAGVAAGLAIVLALAMRAGMSGVVATATIAYGAAAACMIAVPRHAVTETAAAPRVAVGS